MSWLSRVTNTFRTQKLDQDLYDELRFHIDERVDELIRRGHTFQEAEQEAIRHLGNPHRMVEYSRDVKVATWLESLLQDVRFGCRLLARWPISYAMVVLSLSLAIGAATTVFSVIDALLLRSLPVSHPENLIYLSYTGPGSGGGAQPGENVNFSFPMLDRLRQAGAPALQLFGVSYGGPRQMVKLHQQGRNWESVRPQWIGTNGFQVLELMPFLGRYFIPEDEWPAAESVAVLSHRYWATRFQSDPSILDKRLDLSIRGFPSGTYRIVGVAPPEFDGLEPGAPADLWFPLSTRVGARAARSPEAAYFQIRGRIDRDPQTVQHQLQIAFRAFRAEHEKAMLPPSIPAGEFRGAQLNVLPAAGISSYTRSQYRNPLWIIGAIVVLVLIVACSNIANLLIARAAAREREMALRMSIGAGRGRLIRQMLIESGLLALAACLGALVCAGVAGPAIVAHLGPADFPVYLDLRPNSRLLLFLLGIGAIATLLFGFVPAWRASSLSPAAILRASNTTKRFAAGFLQPLFTVQVSVGFVVLYLSGLFITSFQKLDRVDLGFPTDHISLLTVAGAGGPTETKALLETIRKWPEVQGAAASSCAFVEPIIASAMVFPPDNPAVRVAHIGISPGFLAAMSIRIAQGRDIGPADTPGADPETVIVNEAFVRHLLPGRSPIGALYDRRTPRGRVRQTIIGVVPDARYVDTRSADVPTVFVPYQFLGQGIVTIRGTETSDPAVWQSRLEAEFPQLRLVANTSYSALLYNRSLRDRLLAWLSAFLALLTVAVVVLGLHGVLGYAFARRRQELALRMAVGGPLPRVVMEVLRSTARVTALGVVIGIGVSVALTPLVVPLLFQSPSLIASIALPVASLAIAWILTALPLSAQVWRINPALPLRQQ